MYKVNHPKKGNNIMSTDTIFAAETRTLPETLTKRTHVKERAIETIYRLTDTGKETKHDGLSYLELVVYTSHSKDYKRYRMYTLRQTAAGIWTRMNLSVGWNDPAPVADRSVPAARYSAKTLLEIHKGWVETVEEQISDMIEWTKREDRAE